MEFQLAPTAAGEGYRLESFASVGSTNTLALDRALEGDAGTLWLVSDRQKSGRGRRGRTWTAPQGNLAATLLLTDITDLAGSATLGFVAGLAAADALEAVAAIGRRSAPHFELKWPNDVLANGAKLVGILLESAQLPGGRFGIGVGIGINVVSHPGDLPYPATSLAELGVDCTAAEMFLALSDAWIDNMRLWDGGRGLSAVRNRWLARAAGLGAEVTVRLHTEVLHGIFETIDDECRLVFKDRQGGLRKIAAGDVHFSAVAAAAAG